ncbi:MAG TPA: cytochrome c oxidase assembly protein [Actinomycetota bacterium]|nr:cytochrome c oxidase assembly protein [Actinomycetota bacterium]
MIGLVASFVVFGSIGAVYLRGVRARRRRGLQRPATGSIAAMLAGLTVAALVLDGPADSIADQLFWAHMLQHLALITIVAPLIVLGEPLRAFEEVLPMRLRRAAGHIEGELWARDGAARRTAMSGLVISTVALLAWHTPLAFQTALRNNSLHALEHLTLLVTALFFWWPILTPGLRQRIGTGFAIVEVLVATTVMTVLGAMLTFSPAVWYPAYAAAERAHDIGALADQQLAGLLMWIPSGMLYLVIIAVLFVRWIDSETSRPSDRRGVRTAPSPERSSAR